MSTFTLEPKNSLQNLTEVCVASEYGTEGVIEYRKHVSKEATNSLKAEFETVEAKKIKGDARRNRIVELKENIKTKTKVVSIAA